MTTRRTILQWMLGGASVGATFFASSASPEPADKQLRILVLGGTGFLGPHQIERALARGHQVTMFNRGVTAPGLYGNRVEALIGNRDSKIDQGLTALEGTRRWDIVIDNSGYLPRHVRDSANLLHGRVGRYLYVSTISAYQLEGGGTFSEKSRLSRAAHPADEQGGYGPMKALCDGAVRDIYGKSALVVRPTYIVGPRDETDRFTYWVDRLSRGGEVLGPPHLDEKLQWIDVRDLSDWMITMAERGTAGVYNAASEPARWKDILATLATTAGQTAHVHPATAELLDELGINFPLVYPDLPQWFIATAAARAAGLKIRPLTDTASATLEWWRTQTPERQAKAGWLRPEEESRALERLRSPRASKS